MCEPHLQPLQLSEEILNGRRKPAISRGLMTIAACYVSHEGVIFGADSTSSTHQPAGGFHFYNNNQKIFQVGENSSLGMVTWGLGNLLSKSYRSLIADLAVGFEKNPPKTVEEVANRWITIFSDAYKNEAGMQEVWTEFNNLNNKAPHDEQDIQNPANRTAQEERDFKTLSASLTAGFCLGGNIPPNHEPAAFELIFTPSTPAPQPRKLDFHTPSFWGAPNFINRLILGIDEEMLNEIQNSPHWTGTPQEMLDLVTKYQLFRHHLPIRDAIDFVHSAIHSTIKAVKFSNIVQICGGPIEIAVVTSDRNFRWVHHKGWDSAIEEWTHAETWG